MADETLHQYLLAFLGMFAFVTGCGEAQSGVRIEGQVTLDGAPLDQGIINFMPTDGQGQTAAARIEQGAYSLVIAAGPKAVSIISEKVLVRLSGFCHLRSYASSRAAGIGEPGVPCNRRSRSEQNRGTCRFPRLKIIMLAVGLSAPAKHACRQKRKNGTRRV